MKVCIPTSIGSFLLTAPTLLKLSQKKYPQTVTRLGLSGRFQQKAREISERCQT